MRLIIQTFGVFLFTALLFIKVAAPHSYCHDDSNETEDCTVCIISLENQQESFDYVYSFEFIPAQTAIIIAHPIFYNSIPVNTEIKSSLFSRPPPSLLFLV